jgi:hypothetical protein
MQAQDSTKKQRKLKDSFSKEEDKIILDFVKRNGPKEIPKLISKLPKRTSRQIREHYRLYLDPNVKHTPFSNEENKMLLNLMSIFGKKWSKIALEITGRTDVQLKYQFKKLTGKNVITIPQSMNKNGINTFQFSPLNVQRFTSHIDPITHQNIFQIENENQNEFSIEDQIIESTEENLSNIGISDDDSSRGIINDPIDDLEYGFYSMY